MQIIQESQLAATREILLPHQLERYKQVSRQMRMRVVGPGGAFQHGFLADQLGISKAQQEKLQTIQKDFQKKLAETTKELKAAAEQEVMDSLTTEQKEKLKELIGDKFKHNPNDWDEQYSRSHSSKKNGSNGLNNSKPNEN